MAYKSPYDTPSYTTATPVKKKKKKVVTPTKSPYDTPSYTTNSPKSPYSGTVQGVVSALNPSRDTTTKPPVVYNPTNQSSTSTNNNQGNVDYTQMSKMISDTFAQNQPKLPEYTPYQSKYDDRIESLLGKAESPTPFSFDPNNPALKQMQDEAIRQSRVDSSRRGRTFDTFADIQAQQAAQGLIPSFYNSQLGQYNKDRDYQNQTLNTMRNIDQTGYNRYTGQYNIGRQNALQGQQDYQTAYDVGQAGAEGAYGRAYDQRVEGRLMEDRATKAEQDIRNQEIAEFGTPLSDQAREHRKNYLDMPEDIKAKLMPLSEQPGGFATSIIRMRAEDPSNPMLPMLEAMRANKVLSDPELLKQYGSEYGMQTGAIGAMGTAAEQQKAEQIQQKVLNELEVMKEKLQNRKYINEISEIQAQIQKIESESAYKDAQTIVQEYKALQEQIVTAGLPAKLTSEINENISQASANYSRGRASEASATSSYASAELSGAKTRTEEATRAGKIKEQEAKATKVQKEVNKLNKEDTNASSLGFKDLYDSYEGDIKEFIKNEAQLYYPEEIKSIVDSFAKIENVSKKDKDSLTEMAKDLGIELD